jgi:membrane-associated protease RseP (regulator of RpoE activity)
MTDKDTPHETDRPSENNGYVVASLAEPKATAPPRSATQRPQSPRPRRRRKKLPLILFVITCISTFWVGAVGWLPMHYLSVWFFDLDAMPIRRAIVSHWQDGLIYMLCLLAILLTHEMGHFLTALRYRVPASFPFFLPFPISFVGTMGAVIGMDGMRANRKEMFDIGLAGPLAGLCVAIPVLLVGIGQLDLTAPAHGPIKLGIPLLVRIIIEVSPPPGYTSSGQIWYSQLNPYFVAGWVGLLITGLNMLPVSQLDGGHTVYTLFGRHSRWISRGFMIAAISYIVYMRAFEWSVMVILVLLMGIHHPPTRDDTVKIGWFRTALGVLSLSIPLLCFPHQLFTLVN